MHTLCFGKYWQNNFPRAGSRRLRFTFAAAPVRFVHAVVAVTKMVYYDIIFIGSMLTASYLLVCCSFDLNYRPSLGTIDRLWSLASPHISSFKIIVFAQANLAPIIKLMALDSDVEVRALVSVQRSELYVLAGVLKLFS
jgi:hypothetical protein